MDQQQNTLHPGFSKFKVNFNYPIFKDFDFYDQNRVLGVVLPTVKDEEPVKIEAESTEN